MSDNDVNFRRLQQCFTRENVKKKSVSLVSRLMVVMWFKVCTCCLFFYLFDEKSIRCKEKTKEALTPWKRDQINPAPIADKIKSTRKDEGRIARMGISLHKSSIVARQHLSLYFLSY